MIDKVYLEITNLCNLSCSFCHKTGRTGRMMTPEEFDRLTEKLEGKVRYLYFHLMGEPTLHPSLPDFIDRARARGFLPMLTTNGTRLAACGDALVAHPLHKISISIHAPEANPQFADERYLEECAAFARRASEVGTVVALRLWNLGSDADNSELLARLHAAFPEEWEAARPGESERLAPRIYLEWGERFDWPDADAPPYAEGAPTFCHGLRNHIGVLVDGTVVPCCLDADGALALGNLFDTELEEILASPRAVRIREGFAHRTAVEGMCKSCGFATKFKK